MSKTKPIAARLRTYHRWISALSVIVLTWITITGLALTIDLITEPRPPEAPRLPPVEIDAAAAVARSALDQVATRVRARPTEVYVDLGQSAGVPRIRSITYVTGRASDSFAPAADGTMTSAEPAPPPQPGKYLAFRIRLHQLLERLHRGNIIGLPGQVLSVLGGFSFLFLTVSGIWMYVDLLKRRRRAGRNAFFWRL